MAKTRQREGKKWEWRGCMNFFFTGYRELIIVDFLF